MRSHSSALESNKQNPRDRTLDLPFFFLYKHITSLKNLPLPVPNESLPYWFQGNFAASFVFNFCLREFLLSAFANRFELRCEPKLLMLLYYKICPCLSLRISKSDKGIICLRSLSIDDCAKEDGKEFFTKMHCTLKTNP